MFERNVEKFEKHNAEKSNYKMGVNQFADMVRIRSTTNVVNRFDLISLAVL